ncbi:hypothetical protein E2C01_036088 [Portunus trituberculatus]|uniref:Uncharacterized protein n=1 Tax=Portunus trituberculatus TaxID=210409 RepID=A0A5B7FAX5_PORTR|nr:hypothetical protein [Portunus trituberculatus]
MVPLHHGGLLKNEKEEERKETNKNEAEMRERGGRGGRGGGELTIHGTDDSNSATAIRAIKTRPGDIT